MRKVDPAKYEEKRLQILEAAGTCFAKRGFQGASIAEICTAAKISPGHLYHYFSSKEDIIAAMAEIRLGAATDAIGRILNGPDPVRAFLREMGRMMPPVDQGATPLSLEVIAEAGRNPAIAEILQSHSRAVRHLLSDVLRKGQADGQVDPGLDPDLAARLLLGVVDGAKIMGLHEPGLDRGQAESMLDLFVSRFLAPPTSLR